MGDGALEWKKKAASVSVTNALVGVCPAVIHSLVVMSWQRVGHVLYIGKGMFHSPDPYVCIKEKAPEEDEDNELESKDTETITIPERPNEF